MTRLAGWLGAALLALCGLPLAWQVWCDAHAAGIDWPFLGAWYGGEILMLYYVGKMTEWSDTPLLFNYGVNTLALTFICGVKLFNG
jgi:hypothetical protein